LSLGVALTIVGEFSDLSRGGHPDIHLATNKKTSVRFVDAEGEDVIINKTGYTHF